MLNINTTARPGKRNIPTNNIVQILSGMFKLKYTPITLNINTITNPNKTDFINHFNTFHTFILLTTTL